MRCLYVRSCEKKGTYSSLKTGAKSSFGCSVDTGTKPALFPLNCYRRWVSIPYGLAFPQAIAWPAPENLLPRNPRKNTEKAKEKEKEVIGHENHEMTRN
jgi:hypothetical protein